MLRRQKRDNAYFLQRLRDEHPSIHADFVAGRYRSLRQALMAAGLKTDRTPLLELKNAWKKADASEQAAFLQFLTSQGTLPSATTTVVATPTATSSTSIAVDGRLVPSTKARIEDIRSKRDLRPGELMRELGLSPHDQSLQTALTHDSRLRPDVLRLLAAWIEKNKHI